MNGPTGLNTNTFDNTSDTNKHLRSTSEYNHKVPEGPVGDLNNDPVYKKMATFDLYMTNLLKICSLVINNYIENPDLIKSIIKDLNLSSESDVDNKEMLSGFERFDKGFKMTNDYLKKQSAFLSLFNKILNDKPSVLFQAINEDTWIRRENVKLMLGENVGKVSSLVVYLSQIYKYALAIKDNTEKKIKEYPELYKPDDKVRYPTMIIYYCFRIFLLTDVAQNSDKSKTLQKVVTNYENVLGLNTDSNKRDFMSLIKNSIEPALSVGTDLLNKMQGPSGTQGPKINENQLRGVINKVFAGDSMSKVLNSIQNSSRGANGTPDIGNLFSSIIQNINPQQIMGDLQSAVTSEIPEMAKMANVETGTTSKKEEDSIEIIDDGTFVPDEVGEVVEEEIDEEAAVDIIEETVEETVEEH